jgi:hypothetical protein
MNVPPIGRPDFVFKAAHGSTGRGSARGVTPGFLTLSNRCGSGSSSRVSGSVRSKAFTRSRGYVQCTDAESGHLGLDIELKNPETSRELHARRATSTRNMIRLYFPGTRPTGSCRYAVARDSHVTCSKDGVQDVRTVPVVWLPVASRDGKEITGGADDHAQD